MPRHLLSVRRVVPLDRLDEYLDAWSRLREAVRLRGGRAWLFRSSARQDHLLEFVEWQDGPAETGARPAPLSEEWIAAARAPLDERFGMPGAEEWEEVQ